MSFRTWCLIRSFVLRTGVKVVGTCIGYSDVPPQEIARKNLFDQDLRDSLWKTFMIDNE